ncbi:MAG: hypothetical protein RL483_965 [Pseudomonadota bacterium]
MLDRPHLMPARVGQAWLLEGFALFHRQPLVWFLTLVAYWAGLMLIGSVPLVGLIVPLLLSPGLGFGFINLARAIDRQESATPTLLISGFRNGRARALLQLGALYSLALAAVLLLASMVGGGQLMQMVERGATEQELLKLQRELPWGLIVGFLAYIPVMMAFWFAPQLVVWKGLSVPKALFFSWMSVWVNRSAFLRYSLAWLLLVVAISLVISLILSSIGGSPQTMLLMVMPISLLLMAIGHGSFYASTRDVFEARTEPLT